MDATETMPRTQDLFGGSRMSPVPDPYPVYKRLRDEQPVIATNSVILHEVYFDGLGGPGGDPTGVIGAALERDFGSIPTWRREFTAIGKALAGSPGWVVLAYSSRLGRLVNYRAADDAHSLALR
jgi:superoxide dismutase